MSDKSKNKKLDRRFWCSAKGFWKRDGGASAWLLSSILIILLFLNLGGQYIFNVWNKIIFDAIEKRDAGVVYLMARLLLPIAIAIVTIGVMNVWARMSIQRRWRAWLANHITIRWLKDGHYYQLNFVGGDHSNPEYRISEDLRISTDAPIDFAAGIMSAGISAITFIFVL